MQELGRRRQRMPPPAGILWADLAAPRRDGPRVWLSLLDDERWPSVLESVEGERVMWSSPWPHRPADRIVLEVAPDPNGSTLEFVWLAGDPLPTESTIAHIRKRLNVLLFAELRFSYGQ